MIKSFQFKVQSTFAGSPPDFLTGLASIGELYLRNPEQFGLSLPDEIRTAVQKLFPGRGSIESALVDIQNGNRNVILEQIPCISIRYAAKN